MKTLFFAFSFSFFLSTAVYAVESCVGNFDKDLANFRNSNIDPDLREASAKCLVRNNLGENEVALALTVFLKDPESDPILKEAVIESLALANFRKTIKLDSLPTPVVGHIERSAAERTVASASPLLEVAAAIHSSSEVVAVTRHEGEIVRAIFAVAQNEKSNILLRKTAIDAGEKILFSLLKSGVYEESLVRQATNIVQSLSDSPDSDSVYFLGVNESWKRLSSDPKVMLALNGTNKPTRNISSTH